MTKNKRKKHGTSKRQYSRARLLLTVMLLTVTAAGCFGRRSKPAVEPTATPEPTTTPSSGTAFTPSGTGGRVTFTEMIVEVSEAKVGDTVRFGSYEQDNDLSNGAETIEWLVLDKQDGKLLLLSKDALDAKPYNEEDEDVTWETCTLRNWLNGEFYDTAFSSEEQKRIATTKVKNEDNPEYGTEGGKDTKDKVFLLSIEEVLRYFDPDPIAEDHARYAYATRYAFENGAWIYDLDAFDCGYASTGFVYSTTGSSCWWLRSPGDSSRGAASVHSFGSVACGGSSAGNRIRYDVVRPAFWLNLES